ncbi:unnamed protein product [Tetraodon nigroviridis]|uniref:(spotted green pufferfish) hypothetical protein n=1 Tax=Tetraodon nigroviridis TaxID=99883 RepID=Q4SNN4_TETNG|nr:unnamed protein product [Tetraodon nigroviridis]
MERREAERQSRAAARGQWASKTEYILVVAGNVVGLGNVWRFPYLCYRYGGGIGYGYLMIKLYDFCYVIVQAWALFYLVFSFRSELPWVTCNNSWNTGLDRGRISDLLFVQPGSGKFDCFEQLQ